MNLVVLVQDISTSYKLWLTEAISGTELLSPNKREIYLATLASSCSGSALEVARFLKIRNRELRFLLPEEL